MKVTVHTMYFLPEFGSAPILMNELASYLAGRGHEVEVVTTIPRPPHQRKYRGAIVYNEQRDGFVARRYRTNATESALGRLVAWSLYTFYTWLNLFRVSRKDVVFLRLPPLQLGLTGIFARLWKGTKFILNLQDIHPDLSIESGILRNPLAIRMAQAFERWIYKHSDTIVVISEGFRKNLLDKGVAAEKIHVLPNWVDTDVLRPLGKSNPVARRFGLDKKFVAMYSGTISISSNVALERVLEAARIMRGEKDFLVVIVGEGLKKQSLQDKARALGLKNIRFLPFQPYEDLPALLSSSDVLLVPLDKEKSRLSVPSKLYNFMAAGRPILGLADASSEVAEIIARTMCGLCVEPDNVEGIAQALRALKKAPARRKEMAGNGRRYAEKHYSKRAVLREYERLMLSLR